MLSPPQATRSGASAGRRTVADGAEDSIEAGKAIGRIRVIAGASETNATRAVKIRSLLYLRLTMTYMIMAIIEISPRSGGMSCSRYHAVIFLNPPIRRRMVRAIRVISIKVTGMRRTTRQRCERQVGDSELFDSKVAGSIVLVLFQQALRVICLSTRSIWRSTSSLAGGLERPHRRAPMRN